MPIQFTSPDNIEYPQDVDRPDIPLHMQGLATSVQTALTAHSTADAKKFMSGFAGASFTRTSIPANPAGGMDLPTNAATFTSEHVTREATSHLVINKTGWWSFSAYVKTVGVPLTTRAYVEAILEGRPSGLVYARFSFGVGEDKTSCTGIIPVETGQKIWFQVYHSQAFAVQFEGSCFLKFIGTNP